jgi:hypothetical protein
MDEGVCAVCAVCALRLLEKAEPMIRGLMPRRHPKQDIQQALAYHDEMRAAGAEIAVAVGVDAALAQLERWGVLRGQVQ